MLLESLNIPLTQHYLLKIKLTWNFGSRIQSIGLLHFNGRKEYPKILYILILISDFFKGEKYGKMKIAEMQLCPKQGSIFKNGRGA